MCGENDNDEEVTEICRDGKCQKLLDIFCFNDYDCGWLTKISNGGSYKTKLKCLANICVKRDLNNEIFDLTTTNLKCDPGEVLQDNKCIKQDG